MPGFLLHEGATVLCAHGGQAAATAASPRVKVMGRPAVLQPNPWVIVGCPHRTGALPSPCVTAEWVIAATRVRSGGQPLLLQERQAVCNLRARGWRVGSFSFIDRKGWMLHSADAHRDDGRRYVVRADTLAVAMLELDAICRDNQAREANPLSP